MNFACVTTPRGEGAISVIEIIGADCKSLVAKIFKPKMGTDTFFSKSNKSYYGKISKDGEILDEVICRYIPKEQSFSGEYTIEVCCHGGIIATKKILEALSQLNIREITQDDLIEIAHKNRKIDAIQAEALKLLPYAKTELAASVLLDQYNGALSKAIADAHLPKDIDILLATANFGISLTIPQKIVIVGETNVGKSTLFNTLVGKEMVIVDPTPGTTRDPISEIISIKGVPLELTDTAGIGKGDDELEKLSMERARQKMAQADLLLVVHDKVPYKESITFNDKKRLVIFNKADLWCISPPNAISTLYGDGIEQLKEKILTILDLNFRHIPQQPIVFTPRQKSALETALLAENFKDIKRQLGLHP